MDTRSRYIIGIASLALVFMYILPIWKITLDAPQYPEGLGLEIHIDNIVGQKAYDLDNVNNLNHYIGMKRIEPESIPELVWMPWIIGGIIALGLLTALIGKRWMLYVWVAVFIGIAAVGLYDFYLWEYDYGHNLDQEKAIIKIPGMNYQPPLIGTKQLLNFTASSWPALGGIIAFLSMGAGLFVAFYEIRKPGIQAKRNVAAVASIALTGLMLFVLPVLSGCTPSPKQLTAGVDRCTHCMMPVSDLRFGAEIVYKTGKVLAFDAVECMGSYMEEHEVTQAEDIHSLWVIDFNEPGRLIPVEDALFLHSQNINSPMGMNLAGYDPSSDLSRLFSGEVLDWEGVRLMIQSESLHTHVHGPISH